MSLLQLKEDTRQSHDPSAEGEDLAKGSGYFVWTALAAFVLITVAITLFLLSDRKPPVAVGEVTQIWAHSVHTINTPHDANGVPTAAAMFDQVLVFSQVRVRNQSDQPIVLKDVLTNVTLEDGPRSSYAASAIDYDRIFIAYPEMKGLRSKTLVRDTIIQPNEVLDGMVVSAFHVSKDQWAARKDLNISLEFKYHPSLVLVPKAGVIEQ